MSMAKVRPHIDLGVGYVRISRLPLNQAIGIRQHLSQICILNLKTDEGLIDDAIEYSQYEYWFEFLNKSAEQYSDI